MDEVVYLNDLFDIYGELLTDKQQDYFRDYYFDNLSYGEIASKYDVSRNAIFKQLKFGTDKLKELEGILHIYEKNNKIKDLINNISDENIVKELEKLLWK